VLQISRLRLPTPVPKPGGFGRTDFIALTALLLALVGTRMVFLAANPFTLYPASDEHGYLLIAREFGAWWSHGNAVRGPLYPGLLSSLGSNFRLAQALNVTMEAAALAMTFMTVRWRWGRPAAVVTGVTWVLYGPFAYHDYTLIPEMANVLLATAFSCACLRIWLVPASDWRWTALAGLCLGLLELLRPGAGRALAPVLLLVVLRAPGWRARLTRMAIGVGVAVLVVTPWLVRNNDRYERPLLSTMRPYGLLVGVPPQRFVAPGPPLEAFGFAGSRPTGMVDNESRATFFSRRDDIYRREDARILDAWLRRYGRRYAGRMLSEHIQRPARLWLGSSLDTDQIAGFRVLRGDSLRGPFHVLHIAIIFLALLALLTVRGLARATLPWIAVLGLVTVVTVLIVTPQPRYALSYVPLALAYVGVGAGALLPRLTPPRLRTGGSG
jgi:4-amino-4-deoxy-L-arabinose transferase-like glycosyltransferase